MEKLLAAVNQAAPMRDSQTMMTSGFKMQRVVGALNAEAIIY